MQFELPNVSLYYNKLEVPGTRPIVFVHSALGTHHELEAVRARFQDRTTYTIDLPGHGNSSTDRSNLTSGVLAAMLWQFFSAEGITQPDIIGYSLGGYAALELAAKNPGYVRSVVSHAMKFYWTPEAIESSTNSIEAATLKERSAKFYAALAAAHTAVGADKAIEYVQGLMRHFALRQLTVDEITSSGLPVLLTLGDSDDLIPLSELLELYKAIGMEQSCMAVFPNTRHAIRTVPLDLFEHSVRTFWNTLKH